jgi:hypothetical protein
MDEEYWEAQLEGFEQGIQETHLERLLGNST